MTRNRQFYLDLIKTNNITSISQLKAYSPALYLYYTRHKSTIGELPLSKSKKPNNYYTKEICSKLARNYAHRSDFQANEKGAYFSANKNGWLNEICSHMVAKSYIKKGGKVGVAAANRIDIVGQRFNNWTVIGRAGVGKKRGWTCKCECGTISELSTSNLKQGLSKRCSKCSNQISRPVKEIYEYILSLGVDAKLSYKNFGFEIDIWVPEKKFFIEYDGLIWHSTRFRASKSAEKSRYEKLQSIGTGIRIFEDQYLSNKNLVLKMISHRLGCKSENLPTDIELKIVTTPSDYRDFCDSYHIDGYGRSSWAIVATSGPHTLAFMGFRPYMSGKYKGKQELSRFCTNYNFNCYGLFSKMLKLAKTNIKNNSLPTIIVSASDNCISNGAVYFNNGFRQESESDNWYYYLHSRGLRMHRAKGKKLKPPKITEEEYKQHPTEKNQVESGFWAYKKYGRFESLYKIFGWGQKLWVLKF